MDIKQLAYQKIIIPRLNVKKT